MEQSKELLKRGLFRKHEEGQSQVLSAALEIAEEESVETNSRFRALVAWEVCFTHCLQSAIFVPLFSSLKRSNLSIRTEEAPESVGETHEYQGQRNSHFVNTEILHPTWACRVQYIQHGFVRETVAHSSNISGGGTAKVE
ncbi:unnamed protein product [Fraxinus pennsylvanica]|uniref:Uncharacterized protein n=1 Tax=Fraxinus pennsylvanica TaxID=56036 RepID=A0AAD1YV39_9LAMI|nr:unnamed protein product [Fraxinus pennsylvanica]